MTFDPESRQLQSLLQERGQEALPLRSEQIEKGYTHYDSVTGMTSKVVTKAGGRLLLHKDAGPLYRSQAEASNTLTRGSLPDIPHGVIQILTVAAGTGPQTLTRSALAGTGQIDHLAVGMTAALMTVSMTAGVRTGTLFMSNQRGVRVMVEKPLMTKEAHAARTGSHRLTQCMISMTCQEVAGCAVSGAVAPSFVSHACHILSLT